MPRGQKATPEVVRLLLTAAAGRLLAAPGHLALGDELSQGTIKHVAVKQSDIPTLPSCIFFCSHRDIGSCGQTSPASLALSRSVFISGPSTGQVPGAVLREARGRGIFHFTLFSQ